MRQYKNVRDKMSNCNENQKVTLFDGADKTFRMTIKKGGIAKDLTGLVTTAILFKLPLLADDETSLDVSLTPTANGSVITIFAATSGIIDITMKSADIALLLKEDDIDAEIIVDSGAGPEKDQLINMIDIKASLFV